ncbi:urea-proton symporter DUR3-like [Gigantopelta aegis]|uniref:urea-proton symporter DUR3-like n=1 Tax=Gigantopelta aegis TaxID=1735272 RepID=UPI001B889806|nr:urea-proton symporter DUR3-like [Gigantopelta aegis]
MPLAMDSIKIHTAICRCQAEGLETTCLNIMLSVVSNSLDTSFDAGGKVNVGLTATTIVSQWTWAATLLQSSTVASKYGIAGPFWYAAGATVQILLFSILSVQLKIRAPGAKTFLQVVRARFGRNTHKVFCVFALLTNITVTAMLMLGGAVVITNLVANISLEYATVLVSAVIGAYTFIGGLGATFYVSYFNTAIIYTVMLIFLLKVYGEPNNPDNPLGSITKIYNLLSCSQGPKGNMEGSYLTIVSNPGLMFGLINIVGNFGTVFVDQSYWQSSVAAKPRQGVMGFLFGGLCWFAVPFSLATTMGLAYIALGTQQGLDLLSADQVDAGLVPPVVAQRLLGKQGSFLILVMVLMAVTSTGSSEIMAVSSILVYDVYGIYLKPYRSTTDANSCILCGKGRGRLANARDKCACHSMTVCSLCFQDDSNRASCRRAIKPDYKCQMHGQYRMYMDLLTRLKNWCLIWSSLLILPLTVFLYMLELSLGWVYLFMGVMIGSAVIPIALALFWERLNSIAMMSGAIGGVIIAFTVWLSVASTYEDGLREFIKNTGQELSMLCGNLAAILSGGIITIVVTFITNRNYDATAGKEIWENTRDIDNPLSPWTEKYAVDLNLTGVHQLDNRPSLVDVEKAFKLAKYVAIIGSITLSIVLIIIWPSIMVTVGVMSPKQFFGWATLSQVWAFIATVFIILVPLVNEMWDIYVAFHDKRKIGEEVNIVQIPAVKRSMSATVKDIEDEEDAGVNHTERQTTSVSLVGPEVENVNILEGSENPRQPIF